MFCQNNDLASGFKVTSDRLATKCFMIILSYQRNAIFHLSCLIFLLISFSGVGRAQGIASGSIYNVRSQCSNKSIDISASGLNNGADAIQRTTNNSLSQQWLVESTDSGYFKLTAQHSQKSLDVRAAGTMDGSRVQQWSYGNGLNQQWRFIDLGDGSYKVESRMVAGKLLTLRNAGKSINTPIEIRVDYGRCSTHWRFELVPSSANVFYVSPSGSNSNPGTISQPFQTVQKCADVATAGKTCVLRAGIYRETVTPAFSGTLGNPIRFESYPGEDVTVSGADAVGGWTNYQSNIYQTSITLPVNGYSDTGFLANQLFAAGQMMPEARFPNTPPTNNLLQPNLLGGSVIALNETDVRIENGSIPNISEGWSGATIWQNEWFVSRTGTVTGGSNGVLTGTMSAGWNRNGYWFYLTGKLGLLDSPGEWFYSGNLNRLYFWSPDNNAPQAVEVKKRNFAFDLSDRSFIEVKNVRLFAATITTNEASNNVVLDGLNARYVSHYVTLPPLPAAEQSPGSDNLLIVAAHAHDTGIQLRGTNNTLKNSRIEFSAGNGVLLKGSNHTVENNYIRDTNYGSTYAAPIRINGGGHRITRNTIDGSGRDAIVFDWHTAGFVFPNTEISYNDVKRFGALSSDLGAIYICCNTDQTGTRIHHNSIHDPYGYSYFWDVAGIYTDNSSYNATVDHNVIWNMNSARLGKGLKIAGSPGRGVERVFNNTLLAQTTPSNNAAYQFRNNIFRVDGFSTGPNFSNNLFSDVDPLFANPNNGDFTLLNGSSAIDAGIVIPGITDGYSGSNPDIGAFESGQTPWQAGSTLAP